MMGRSIHLPSSLDEVSAQNTHATTDKKEETPRQRALRLSEHKNNIEAELDSLAAELEKSNATMDTELVDSEGYPRNDIDVAKVRTLRSRIIRLRNDWKEAVNMLAEALPLAFEDADNDSDVNVEEDSSADTNTAEAKPFSIVTAVHPSSPASDAGLLRDDKIIKFGTVNHSNHDNLRAIKSVVVENSPITLVVQRQPDDSTHTLTLTPKSNWGGRGLLGCHIVSLDT